ncbi:HipA protein, DNA binding regulator (plasmid) [Legionella adelaidensis]|uniref:HipA protein, DNA binding regulator n=1 Tax=Legionella adelaidensis TaxID=45056 RepID=A0A0W0R2B4_9GAMM|nr:type II toxin-antitoxin system HipA family toxin [Legionella adelaidensis]KTC65162.1 HipA protein, DNA binding regulator [Legionella adelaidensis]VEH85054.1 HipA protein, DNA binding regulator [Legionella adelaidensis]
MGRKRFYSELYVYMNGLEVGRLRRESLGQLIFQYNDDWLNSEIARPISLSMPLTEVPYKGYVVECYFENLLPDNDIIRNRIQKRFHTSSTQCFDLLSYIGKDCVGALQLLTTPLEANIKKICAVSIKEDDIATLLKGYETAPLGMHANSEFRISIAGAQEKTALLWYQDQWCLPQGTTPTSHIIKLPIGKIIHAGIDLSESIENEWLCLQILSAYGLPVNHAEIVQFADTKTLVVQRFDRVWAQSGEWIIRLPQEDFCQVLAIPPGLKYESDGGPGIKSIMDILQNAEQAVIEREKFFKTVFLFWVLGAIDGHAKNFSILLKAEGRFSLTPIYDVMSAYPLAEKRELEWKKLKMAMALRSSTTHYTWETLLIRHWLTMARKCNFPEQKMKEIIVSTFDKMEDVIAQVEKKLPSNFPLQMSEAIFAGMRKIKARFGASQT